MSASVRFRARLAAAAWLVAAGAAQAQSANDPLEGWNRAVFGFNEGLDAAVLKPVATGYTAVVPELVRIGVHNFIGNFRDGWSAINQLLQAKPVAAAQMTVRVATNTLFGIGGLFDLASDLGIERRSEDFGQTLGRWGVAPGPYLVLPLIGPSTLRDTAALALDWQAIPEAFLDQGIGRFALTSLHVISVRAGLLSATRALDEIALDKYSLLRDGYLARRRNLVYDGDPPEEPEASDNEATEDTAPK
jgi:phospholipid-binding lipoprotein MlaA